MNTYFGAKGIVRTEKYNSIYIIHVFNLKSIHIHSMLFPKDFNRFQEQLKLELINIEWGNK